MNYSDNMVLEFFSLLIPVSLNFSRCEDSRAAEVLPGKAGVSALLPRRFGAGASAGVGVTGNC